VVNQLVIREGRKMAKNSGEKTPRGRGRPSSLPEGKKPETVLISRDLRQMISAICRVDEISAPNLIDPLLRPAIASMYASRFKLIREHYERVRDAAIARGQEPPEEPPELTTISVPRS
jgi:hypothetical protein